jgi:hypothetical protein
MSGIVNTRSVRAAIEELHRGVHVWRLTRKVEAVQRLIEANAQRIQQARALVSAATI